MAATTRFFRGLSLALAHRVEPRAWYMPMTAYFDESGTHGDSPAVIVAGFGATVAQWTGFEKRVARLFGDFGIVRFHAKDFRGTKGDFTGWDVQKKGIFNSKFLQITDNQLSFAVAGITTPDEYLKHYREKRFPRGVRVDTIYGICFRTALLRATLDFEDRPNDWPLNVVLELGHKNAQDAVRIFDEVKKRPQFAPLFGTITFASKEDCVFLAVADSLAYALFRKKAGYTKHPTIEDAVPFGPADPPYYVHKLKSSATILNKRGLTKLHRIDCGASYGLRRPS